MPPPNPHGNPGGPGIWKHKGGGVKADVKEVVVSYQNDDLAQLIVDVWADNPSGIQQQLLGGLVAQRIINARTVLGNLPTHPVRLAQPIVISEAEYNDGWEADDDVQVIFVLPDAARKTGTVNLLETAKLLMAAVPNGI
jgi:hypothetical protein